MATTCFMSNMKNEKTGVAAPAPAMIQRAQKALYKDNADLLVALIERDGAYGAAYGLLYPSVAEAREGLEALKRASLPRCASLHLAPACASTQGTPLTAAYVFLPWDASRVSAMRTRRAVEKALL